MCGVRRGWGRVTQTDLSDTQNVILGKEVYNASQTMNTSLRDMHSQAKHMKEIKLESHSGGDNH